MRRLARSSARRWERLGRGYIGLDVGSNIFWNALRTSNLDARKVERVSDIKNLRRILDEPPPTPEQRELARQMLRSVYGSPRQGKSRSWGKLGLGTAVAATVVFAVMMLRVDTAEAWSPVPESPPESLLLASAPVECATADAGSQAPLLVDQRNDVAVALFGERSAGDRASSFRTCTLAFTDGSWHKADARDLAFTLLVTAGSVDEQIIGAAVERVVIDTASEQVEVSYDDGFYLMWWPEDLALAGEVMRFLGADGSSLLEIPVRSR